MHPRTVVYLEHDGKLLLVDGNGDGPKDCIMGRNINEVVLRFPTPEEVEHHGIAWTAGRETDIRFGNETYTVLHVNQKWIGPSIGPGKTKSSPTTLFTQ